MGGILQLQVGKSEGTTVNINVGLCEDPWSNWQNNNYTQCVSDVWL